MTTFVTTDAPPPADGPDVPFAQEVDGAVTLAGIPEALLGITTLRVIDDMVTGSMDLGPWLAWEGTGSIAAGSLGVLVDDVVAYCLVRRRPDGTSPVTTEIAVDFLRPFPIAGRLLAQAQLVHLDDRGGLARGKVFADDGTLIAVVTLRGRFVPIAKTSVQAPDVLDKARDGGLGRLLWPDGGDPLAGGGTTINVPVGPRVSNHVGNLHGGVSLMLCDAAATSAAMTDGSRLSPASIHMSYLRPVPLGTTVTVEAAVVHRGRTSGMVTVQGYVAAGKTAFTATVVLH